MLGTPYMQPQSPSPSVDVRAGPGLSGVAARNQRKFCHLERVVELLGLLPTKIICRECVAAIWGLLYFLPFSIECVDLIEDAKIVVAK